MPDVQDHGSIHQQIQQDMLPNVGHDVGQIVWVGKVEFFVMQGESRILEESVYMTKI